MKVLHVNTERGWRGGEQQLLLLAAGLRSQTRDITQHVVGNPGSPLLERAQAAGFETTSIAMRGSLDRSASQALRSRVRDLEPTVVHAHTSHAHSLAWAAVRRLGTARPRVLVSRHVAYSIHRHVPLGLARIKYNRQCDALLCVSEAVRRRLEEDGVREGRLHVVHNGIDPSAWTRDMEARTRRRAALHIDDTTTLLGAVGALTPEKGHADLLEAFAALPDTCPPVALALVGEGPERGALEARIAAHPRSSSIHLLGFQDDVRAWLSAFDVLVVASRAEGFPLTTLQGMAAGLPLVATRAGGIVEQLEHKQHGFLAPTANPPALATALERMLADDGAARAMGAAGAKHVSARFHYHATARATAELYAHICR